MSATALRWLFGGWFFGSPDVARSAQPRQQFDRPQERETEVRSNVRSSRHRILDLPEPELIARLKAGDEQAFDAVFQHHIIGLIRFATPYAGTREAAEDIVQEVFLTIWNSRAHWSPNVSVSAYLYGAVRNRALDAVKHDRIVARHVAVQKTQRGALDMHVPDPAEVYEAQELADRLDAQVATLPPRTREVFLLYRDGGLSYQAIADTLGIAVNTVYVQMGRAVSALQGVVQRFSPEE